MVIKSNKKALGLAVEFASVKEDMLKLLSKFTSSCSRKLNKLSTTQIAQILSVVLHDEKRSRSLLFIENNVHFLAEYLSQDRIRELNNKNIRRNRIHCFPIASKEVWKMVQINSYLRGNKEMRVSFTLASQNRIMDNINILSTEPQAFNKSYAH